MDRRSTPVWNSLRFVLVLISSAVSCPPSVWSTPLQSFDSTALIWVPYNNRWDFLESPGLIKSLLCGDSSFGVDEKAVMPALGVDADLSDFSLTFAAALATLSGKPNTDLYVAIDSHGSKGFLDCQKRKKIPYSTIWKTVLLRYDAYLTAHGKEAAPRMHFFVNTCGSESATKELQKILLARIDIPKINVFTASNDLEGDNSNSIKGKSYGNDFWMALRLTMDVNSQMRPNEDCFTEKDWPTLCALSGKNDFKVWSTYLEPSANAKPAREVLLTGSQELVERYPLPVPDSDLAKPREDDLLEWRDQILHRRSRLRDYQEELELEYLARFGTDDEIVRKFAYGGHFSAYRIREKESHILGERTAAFLPFLKVGLTGEPIWDDYKHKPFGDFLYALDGFSERKGLEFSVTGTPGHELLTALGARALELQEEIVKGFQTEISIKGIRPRRVNRYKAAELLATINDPDFISTLFRSEEPEVIELGARTVRLLVGRRKASVPLLRKAVRHLFNSPDPDLAEVGEEALRRLFETGSVSEEMVRRVIRLYEDDEASWNRRDVALAIIEEHSSFFPKERILNRALRDFNSSVVEALGENGKVYLLEQIAKETDPGQKAILEAMLDLITE